MSLDKETAQQGTCLQTRIMQELWPTAENWTKMGSFKSESEAEAFVTNFLCELSYVQILDGFKDQVITKLILSVNSQMFNNVWCRLKWWRQRLENNFYSELQQPMLRAFCLSPLNPYLSRNNAEKNNSVVLLETIIIKDLSLHLRIFSCPHLDDNSDCDDKLVDT